MISCPECGSELVMCTSYPRHEYGPGFRLKPWKGLAHFLCVDCKFTWKQNADGQIVK